MSYFAMHPEVCGTHNWLPEVHRISPDFWSHLNQAIGEMNFLKCFDKDSSEKTKKGKKVLSPKIMNAHFETVLLPLGYGKISSDDFYPEKVDDAKRMHKVPHDQRRDFLMRERIPFREGKIEGDFFNCGIHLEVQLGKYPFVDWDIDKSIEFFKRGRIKGAAILVPMNTTQSLMSTGPASWQTAMNMFIEKGLHETSPFPIALIGLETVITEQLPKWVRKNDAQVSDQWEMCLE